MQILQTIPLTPYWRCIGDKIWDIGSVEEALNSPTSEAKMSVLHKEIIDSYSTSSNPLFEDKLPKLFGPKALSVINKREPLPPCDHIFDHSLYDRNIYWVPTHKIKKDKKVRSWTVLTSNQIQNQAVQYKELELSKNIRNFIFLYNELAQDLPAYITEQISQLDTVKNLFEDSVIQLIIEGKLLPYPSYMAYKKSKAHQYWGLNIQEEWELVPLNTNYILSRKYTGIMDKEIINDNYILPLQTRTIPAIGLGTKYKLLEVKTYSPVAVIGSNTPMTIVAVPSSVKHIKDIFI